MSEHDSTVNSEDEWEIIDAEAAKLEISDSGKDPRIDSEKDKNSINNFIESDCSEESKDSATDIHIKNEVLPNLKSNNFSKKISYKDAVLSVSKVPLSLNSTSLSEVTINKKSTPWKPLIKVEKVSKKLIVPEVSNVIDPYGELSSCPLQLNHLIKLN